MVLYVESFSIFSKPISNLMCGKLFYIIRLLVEEIIRYYLKVDVFPILEKLKLLWTLVQD